MAWLDGWAKRKKITILQTNIDADLATFPVYVDLTNEIFSEVITLSKADGSDITVTKADGTTQLPRELVSYASSTNRRLWFGAVDIDDTVDTDFYIYYENPSATIANSTSVWPNALAIYHLEEGDTGPYLDSGPNAHSLTEVGAIVAGTSKIGGTIDKGGAADNNYIHKTSGVNGASANWTTVLWAKRAATAVDTQIIACAGNLGSNGQEIGIAISGANFFAVFANPLKVSTTTIGAGTWTRLAGVLDASADTVRGYIDGVVDTPISGPYAVDITMSNRGIRIGTWINAFAEFAGMIDEVHIWNVAQSAAWMKADFLNQNGPQSFYSVGSQETSFYRALGPGYIW